MWGNDIKKGVMAVINQRIEKAQEEHETDVRVLEEQLEKDKQASLDKHIKGILGGI